MKVHEIMTAHARSIAPDNTLVEAAGLMRELDVGALPVVDGGNLAGIITDRDIVVRSIADGRDPNNSTVGEVMSGGIVAVNADQDVEEATRIMEQKQIRRLPVLDRAERVVGIVSLGDIATSSNPAFSGIALRDVSQPRNPSARQRRLASASELQPVPQVPGATRRPGSTQRQRANAGGRSRGAAKSSRQSRRASATKRSSTGGKRRAAGGRKQSKAKKTASRRK
jgi:CBS domain-containing protein